MIGRAGLLLAIALAGGLLAPAAAVRAADVLDLIGCGFDDAEQLVRSARTGGVRILDHQDRFAAAVGNYYAPPVPLHRLPPHLIAALIASEDRRYLDHAGIDWWGAARAAVATARSWAEGDGRVQGGSTLTMQLLKNTCFLGNSTAVRKVGEYTLAHYLESRLSKSDILYAYLNIVPFGRRAHGIEAAARVYFGKGASTLSLLESAVLVQALPAPSRYNPHQNPVLAAERARLLLDAMVAQRRLSPKLAQQAKRQKLALAPAQRGVPGYYAGGRLDVGWFAAWSSKEARALAPGSPGLPTIRSTLWPELQAILAEEMRRAISRHGRSMGFDRGAAIAMSPSGEVLAMIGGASFERQPFNIAVDAERQAGSIFKLFPFLVAIEQGLGPETLVDDSRLLLPSGPIRNHDDRYRGRIPLAKALAVSSNTAAVRLARAGSVPAIQAMARRLGVETALHDQIGMALGTSEVRLLEMTAAYATIASGGIEVRPRGIVEISDGFGRPVWCAGRQPRPARLLGAAQADAMRIMLRRVVTDPDGTGRAADPGFFAAGKTGTTDDNADAWFIGFTERFVVGLWLGNEYRSPARGLTGGGLPARLWKSIVQRAHELERYGRLPCTVPAPAAERR